MAIKFLLTGEGTSRTPPVVGARGTGQINQFKTDSDYVEDVELASIHCVLERLRAAINWGMAQTPLLFGRFPFHRFGGSSGWPKRARHLLDHVDKSRGRMSNARLASIGMFSRILPALAQSRRVVAVEQQGHGHTADVDRPLRFEQMADDTAALLRHIGIEKTDVYGYSTVLCQRQHRSVALESPYVLQSA